MEEAVIREADTVPAMADRAGAPLTHGRAMAVVHDRQRLVMVGAATHRAVEDITAAAEAAVITVVEVEEVTPEVAAEVTPAAVAVVTADTTRFACSKLM